VNAVRADHHIGLDRLAVGEAQPPAGTVHVDRDAAPAEPDVIGGDRPPDRVEQVSAVRGIGAFAVAPLAFGRQVLRRQHPAVPPAAKFPAGRQRHGGFRECAEHPEPAQQAGGVRGDDHARPHLREPGGLLVDGDGQSRPAQEGGGGEAADATADDRGPRQAAGL
jgi:hypothetical protein